MDNRSSRQAGRGIDVGQRSSATWLVLVVHVALLIGAVVIAIVEITPFGGGLLSLLVPCLAVVVAGAIRASRRVVGARILLSVGDIGVVVLTIASLALEDTPFRSVGPAALLALTAVAAVAAASAQFLPPEGVGTLDRHAAPVWIPVAIVVVDVASVATFVSGSAALGAPNLARAAAVDIVQALLPDLVALAAWWVGCRWPIGIAGLNLAAAWILPTVLAAGEPPGFADVLLPAAFLGLTVAAFLRGPAVRFPAGGGRGAEPRNGRAPAPATAWLVIAALLYPLLVLPSLGFGTSDYCRDCAPHTSVDVAMSAWALLCAAFIPLTAFVLIGTANRLPARRFIGAWLLGSSIALGYDVVSALVGRPYWSGFGLELGPVTLLAAAAVLMLRPEVGSGGGWASGFAGGGLVLAALLPLGSASFVSITGPLSLAAAPGAAAILLAIAWESHQVRRGADARPWDFERSSAASGASREGTAETGRHVDTATGPA
jgi:hypothetical protein